MELAARRVVTDGASEHLRFSWHSLDSALGFAAAVISCFSARNLRATCKRLHSVLALAERSSTEARIQEHAQEGLRANDRDIRRSWELEGAFSRSPSRGSDRSRGSYYSLGFSIDSDGHWHDRSDRVDYERLSDFD